jgi:hypothetical protein
MIKYSSHLFPFQIETPLSIGNHTQNTISINKNLDFDRMICERNVIRMCSLSNLEFEIFPIIEVWWVWVTIYLVSRLSDIQFKAYPVSVCGF